MGLESGVILQDGVLLLDTIPWLFRGISIKNFGGKVSEVGVGWHKLLVGSVLPCEGFSEDHDVVSSSEGIWEVEHWFQDDF